MSSRKRILVIENSRQVTGALKSICAMAGDLKGDFDFIFILPSRSAATKWLQSNSSFKMIEVPMTEISKSWRLLFYLPSLIVSALRIKSIIKKENIDIVHSNDLYNLNGWLLKSFGAKFRYICHVRFMPGAFPPWLYNFWLNRQLLVADKIIAVSDVLKSKLKSDPKIIRIHDRMLLQSDQPGVKRNGNTILYLSNIIPGKGHDRALAAFASVHEKFPSWKLKFVGSDMNLEKNRLYRESLKGKAVHLGISNSIEWNDFANDVAAEYASADVFANFSSAESFSMTCLEAQYYGCPVVATNSGGPAEIIVDEESGLLVPVDNIISMAQALERLMQDEDLRESMGNTGARNVREKFGPEKTSGALRSIYMQS